MHNDSMTRGVTRVTRSRGTYVQTARAALFVAAAALTACADDTPTQPKANIPDGGPKSVALGINILPAGQTFASKIAFVTGSPNGKLAYVQVYDNSGTQMARFQAFTNTWDNAGVDVTLGDVTGDGWPDIIAGEGPAPFAPYGSGFGVWDGKTGAWIGGYGMGSGYKNGLRVGAGDIDGDGRDEIFTCSGPTAEGTRYNIMRYNPDVPNIGYVIPTQGLGWYTGKNTYNGCRVAGGDVDGDGKDELIAVFEGPANALLIRNHNGGGSFVRWNALGAGYSGQTSVAAADVNGDKRAELFLGRLTGYDKLPPVFIYDGAGVTPNKSTLPTPTIMYPITNSIYNTGVYIAARDLSGDGIPELLAKMSTTGGPSTYVARMGLSFTTLWLNRTEPGPLPGGGPIG